MADGRGVLSRACAQGTSLGCPGGDRCRGGLSTAIAGADGWPAVRGPAGIAVVVAPGCSPTGWWGSGPPAGTNEEASARVIAQCQSAGGQDCTSMR